MACSITYHEIEPKYVAVALERMADMGLKPVLSKAACGTVEVFDPLPAETEGGD